MSSHFSEFDVRNGLWSAFGVPDYAPEWVVTIVATLVLGGLVVLPLLWFVNYASFKINADLQARVGPNRAGFAGMGQGFADGVKLLQKGHYLTPFHFVSLSVLIVFGFISLPFSEFQIWNRSELAVLLPLWMFITLSVLFIWIGMKAKGPALSSIRAVIQMISGAVPAFLCLISLLVITQNLAWESIVKHQGFSPVYWNVLTSPSAPILFLVFMGSGWVLTLSAPLEGGAFGSEIKGGLESMFAGGDLALFLFFREFLTFLWATFGVLLFLGAWCLPLRLEEQIQSPLVLFFLQSFWVGIKATALCILMKIITSASPRLRSDQITQICWRLFCPVVALCLVVHMLWFQWRVSWGSAMWGN